MTKQVETKTPEQLAVEDTNKAARSAYSRLYNYWLSLINNTLKPEWNELDVITFKEAMEDWYLPEGTNTRRLSFLLCMLKEVYIRGKALGYESVDWIPDTYEYLIIKFIEYFEERLDSAYSCLSYFEHYDGTVKKRRYKINSAKRQVRKYQDSIKAYEELKDNISKWLNQSSVGIAKPQ